MANDKSTCNFRGVLLLMRRNPLTDSDLHDAFTHIYKQLTFFIGDLIFPPITSVNSWVFVVDPSKTEARAYCVL